MRAVVQRVTRAQVRVEGQTAGEIDAGLLVLLGVGREDGDAELNYVFRKTVGLRIFEDDQQKMNLSLLDVGGQLMVVSQFTLYGDVRQGKRPSFISAAPPEQAQQLYERFCQLGRDAGLTVQTGQFQADMQVELVNDGPVTILIDSQKAF